MPAQTAPGTPAKPGTGISLRILLAAIAVVLGAFFLGAAPASAHVLPTSSVQLDVREDVIDATAKIPLDDFEAASGIDLGEESSAAIAAHAPEVTAYLLQHFTPTSDDGQAWAVHPTGLSVVQTGTPPPRGCTKNSTPRLR